MQESLARLHGWRRRGRMGGGGSGGGLWSKGEVAGGSDLMRNSCTRMEGSGLGRGRGWGVFQTPLCNSAELKATVVPETWGCWGK